MQNQKISISLNGKPMKVKVNLSLEIFIINQKILAENIATAVNKTFISKDDRSKCMLKEGDCVSIFSAITGG